MLIKKASKYYKSNTPKTFRPLATYTYLTYIKFLSFNRAGQPIPDGPKRHKDPRAKTSLREQHYDTYAVRLSQSVTSAAHRAQNIFASLL